MLEEDPKPRAARSRARPAAKVPPRVRSIEKAEPILPESYTPRPELGIEPGPAPSWTLPAAGAVLAAVVIGVSGVLSQPAPAVPSNDVPVAAAAMPAREPAPIPPDSTRLLRSGYEAPAPRPADAAAPAGACQLAIGIPGKTACRFYVKKDGEGFPSGTTGCADEVYTRDYGCAGPEEAVAACMLNRCNAAASSMSSGGN